MESTIRTGLEAALNVIGGKWKTLILWELYGQPSRPGELRRTIGGISEKVLIQQLRELERDGLVHREQFHEIPPRVEYSLTPLGRSAMDATMPLCEWGERHLSQLLPEREEGDCCYAPAPVESDQATAARQ